MSTRKNYATSVTSKQYASEVDSIRRSNAFQTFFRQAVKEVDAFANEGEWARQATLAFRRKNKLSTRFPTLYFAFMNELEKHQEGYESESVGDDENSVDSNDTYERDGFVVDDDEVDEAESEESEDEWDDEASCESESIAEEEADEEEPKRSSSNSNMFTQDGEQTQSESQKGQQMLHRIIYKEYNTWYDSFKEEAEEDDDEDAMTADERFSWHCAKVLSRKTDIRAKEIYPIIGAWLIEHHKA